MAIPRSSQKVIVMVETSQSQEEMMLLKWSVKLLSQDFLAASFNAFNEVTLTN